MKTSVEWEQGWRRAKKKKKYEGFCGMGAKKEKSNERERIWRFLWNWSKEGERI